VKTRTGGLAVAPGPAEDAGGATKLERANLSEGVYRRIRKAIMSGRFPPGERLRLATLAEQFGVSITPVREAIFRLVSEGALVMRASTAVSVPVLTAQQLREIQLTRILLEGACAERAALLAAEATVAELDAIHSEYIRAWQRDPVEASELNRQFHFVLAAAGDMPIVLSVIEKMWAMMGPILHTFHVAMKPRRLGVASHRHYEVVRALERRDGPAAREAIQADIHWSDAIIAWVEQQSVGIENGGGAG
jgi:DNA-binding GntR family transcriptional regulator